MKLLLLENPASGRGRRRLDYPALLAERGAEAEHIRLQCIEEATRRAAEAIGYDAVVACGGDGTVRAVADGVLRNPDSRLKMGVLYAGTSPDFCTFHRIPVEPVAAVELLLRGGARPVPVFAIGHDGEESHFCCSCNLGMGADVAAAANRLRPLLGDGLGTFCALLWNLLKAPEFDCMVDGGEFRRCSHLLVTRMPYIAGGLKLALPPLTEEEYAVWLVQGLSFFGWLRLLPELYRGKPAGRVLVHSGVTEISAPRTVKLEYDGDPHGALPVTIRLAARKLNLICGGCDA